eukprot:m.75392 g.75392  ORF g.75392 m.75392 type:complete len:79 (-) comp16172_c1_seq5:85-321(-)
MEHSTEFACVVVEHVRGGVPGESAFHGVSHIATCARRCCFGTALIHRPGTRAGRPSLRWLQNTVGTAPIRVLTQPAPG